MTARILVVDDSAFMRKVISEQISAVEGLTVAGTASNGEVALKKIPLLQPDAVTLDIEMPGMNGLEVLKQIREQYAIPVFMLSSSSEREMTIRALEAGAADFIEKPHNLLQQAEVFREELAMKMQSIWKKNLTEKNSESADVEAEAFSHMEGNGWERLGDLDPRVVVIGASTGGPRILLQIIKSIPAAYPYPVLIVQHMPSGFTASFAERLNQAAKIPVLEVKGGEEVEAGKVYLAPGDYHMAIQGNRITLNQASKIHGVRPAVDVLFESAAESYDSSILGVILTGMGKDGTEGFRRIKKKGGKTIAQNRETSTVYGMPGNAMKAGVVDVSTDVQGIVCILNNLMKVKSCR